METRARTAGRRWLGVAVGSLVLAGLYAVFLVVGRMPPFDRLVTDPAFFRRCLVVHVDLSLVVWFHAFLGVLACWLPVRPGRRAWSTTGLVLATAGIAGFALAAGLPNTQPVLSNYVPAIDHPLFLVGVAAFGVGLAIHLAGRGVLPRRASGADPTWPPAAELAARAAGFAFLLALATFAASALTTPAGLEPEVRYELLAWGGGHVLQFASVGAMLAAWILLLTPVVGRSPVGPRTAGVLLTLLVAPLVGAPVLAAAGTQTWQYRAWFTRLMQLGIFPVVTVFLVLCVAALVGAARDGRLAARAWRDPRVVGFAISALLTLVGFGLGAMIRGSNTVVPAHYHASIGAVTAAFMAVTYPLLGRLGLRLSGRRRTARLAAIQPALFGVGQLVFAVGFAVAGAHGTARKAYGAEQAARTAEETLGLFVMGVGGLVAAAGGILFLGLVLSAWWRRAAEPAPSGAVARAVGGAYSPPS